MSPHPQWRCLGMSSCHTGTGHRPCQPVHNMHAQESGSVGKSGSTWSVFPVTDNQQRLNCSLGITYLNENLPSLSFGWCHGPNTFVEGVLDIIQLHDPGHHLSGLWKGLIGWHHLRFTFTQVGQWILNGGPHSRKQRWPTLGNPSLVCEQGLRKVLDIIREDPWWISSLPSM